MEVLQPLEKQKRIESVDALKGLALLGILLANVPYNENASAENTISGTGQMNNILSFLFHLLIEKKFITIFSMLFGFGFYIQMKRGDEAGINFRQYYFKRMLILFLIGCIHAYLFWFGDITRDYALCGIALLLVYKWSPKKILVTGILFSVFLTATIFIANSVLGLQEYSYDTSIVKNHPLTNSYWEYLRINARIDPFVNFLQDSPITLVFCFGNMLIGFWMAQSGFFQQPSKFSLSRKKLILTGLLAGLSASYLFWLITSGKLELTPALLWLPYALVVGMILQSLFYISAFISLFQTTVWKKILSVFIPVGKMSLTNYLLQTSFYLLVFMHWTRGLQLFGKINIAETYLIAILFFGMQVVFSKVWLKYHDQGPVETIWKNLSYRFSKKLNYQL
jgi:uncharacterized protein